MAYFCPWIHPSRSDNNFCPLFHWIWIKAGSICGYKCFGGSALSPDLCFSHVATWSLMSSCSCCINCKEALSDASSSVKALMSSIAVWRRNCEPVICTPFSVSFCSRALYRVKSSSSSSVKLFSLYSAFTLATHLLIKIFNLLLGDYRKQ